MAKLTRDSLKKLREDEKQKISRKANTSEKIQVIIGMGSCGIAAGAVEAKDAFIDELKNDGIDNVEVTQTGCMGLCYSEPNVEIVMPGMPDIIYGKVDDEVARKIVRKHINSKVLINDHIFDRPALDMIEK
jgi:NADP-reducing hydrogenase subunit HndB